jgi:hypothetical protein
MSSLLCMLHFHRLDEFVTVCESMDKAGQLGTLLGYSGGCPVYPTLSSPVQLGSGLLMDWISVWMRNQYHNEAVFIASLVVKDKQEHQTTTGTEIIFGKCGIKYWFEPRIKRMTSPDKDQDGNVFIMCGINDVDFCSMKIGECSSLLKCIQSIRKAWILHHPTLHLLLSQHDPVLYHHNL